MADRGKNEPTRPLLLGPGGQPFSQGTSGSSAPGLLTQIQNLGLRLRDVGILLTLTAVLMYALIRSAYALFYGRLGVNPEEVGLGYSEVITQSLVGVFALALLFGLLIGVMILAWRLFLVPSIATGVALQRRARLSKRAFLFLYFLVFLLELALLFYIVWFVVGYAFYAFFPLFVFLPGVAIGAKFVGFSTSTSLHETQSDSRGALTIARDRVSQIAKESGLSSRNALLFVMALGLLLVVEQLLIDAPFLASDVRSGQAIAGTRIRFLDFPVLRNRVERAQVWFSAPAPAWVAKDCLMYLGESGGTTVLYAVRSRRVLRVPSSGIGLALDRDAETCPEQVPVGRRMLLLDERIGTRAVVAVLAVRKRVDGLVPISLHIRNTGREKLDEALVNDVIVTDSNGKLYLPAFDQNNLSQQRVILPPGKRWRGVLRFKLPPNSFPTLLEFTLTGGRASRGVQWDLTRS